MIKDIAIEVNYLSLESTIDKYVAKLDEIDEDRKKKREGERSRSGEGTGEGGQ